ncbi:hypothetical protein D3C85_1545160 [compost metagenome]
MVCGTTGIAEPYAALCLNLLEVGSAIRAEHKWRLVFAPRATGITEIGAVLDTGRIALSLVDRGGHVFTPPLRLHDAD